MNRLFFDSHFLIILGITLLVLLILFILFCPIKLTVLSLTDVLELQSFIGVYLFKKNVQAFKMSVLGLIDKNNKKIKIKTGKTPIILAKIGMKILHHSLSLKLEEYIYTSVKNDSYHSAMLTAANLVIADIINSKLYRIVPNLKIKTQTVQNAEQDILSLAIKAELKINVFRIIFASVAGIFSGRKIMKFIKIKNA